MIQTSKRTAVSTTATATRSSCSSVAWMIGLTGACNVVLWQILYSFQHNAEYSKSIRSLIPSNQSGPDEHYNSYDPFWQPLDCRQVLKDFEGSDRDLNYGILHGRRTITTAPFWVSLHNRSVDFVRWDVMEYGLYYERGLTRIFEQILQESSASARVLDVGGNIGWFTLLSASMGHHVDVFEPLEINRARLCQSIVLNQPQWQQQQQQTPLPILTTTEDEIRQRTRSNKHPSIHIRPYGISNAPGTLEIGYRGGNPGSARILSGKPPSERSFSSGITQINMTTLDDMAHDLGWLDQSHSNNNPSHTEIAILKIDIEGNEPRAILGARQLLQSGIVKHLLLEVSAASGNDEDILRMLQSIAHARYKLHQWGGYRGPTQALPSDFPTTTTDPASQAQYIVQQWVPKGTQKQVNLWYIHQEAA